MWGSCDGCSAVSDHHQHPLTVWQVLRGEDSGAELADEEDDEDFVLDWDELLMGTTTADGQPGSAGTLLRGTLLSCTA